MGFYKKSLHFTAFLLLIPLLSVFALAQFVAPNQAGPLSGTFTQSGTNTCVPTGLGVLADTSNISPWDARRIARGIITHCQVNASQGMNIYEGVWGLVRGVLNQSGGTTRGTYSGPAGGTTPNLTINIYTNSGAAAHDNRVNLTGAGPGISVTLHFDGTVMNTTRLNATLSGGGVTGGGNNGGGSTSTPSSPGGTPVGIGFKNTYASLGHFIIALGLGTEPLNQPWGPGGSLIPTYSVLYWDPQDNKIHLGWISGDGTQVDAGQGPSAVTSNVNMNR